jgi:hypothetical protein
VWGRSRDRACLGLVDVDGVRLHTSVRGTGPPLLLITGLGASLDLAEPFEQALVAWCLQVISFGPAGSAESLLSCC